MWKCAVVLILGIFLFIPLGVTENKVEQLIPATAPQFLNADYYRKKIGLDQYEFRPSSEPMKIAVIDQGFALLNKLQGWLPKDMYEVVDMYPKELLEDPTFKELNLGKQEDGRPLDPNDSHGSLFGHHLWSLLKKPLEGYKFYFLNGNGALNLQRAAAFCQKYGISVAGVPVTLDHSGNRKSDGYVNNAFTKAAREGGVIFVVTAGNKMGQVRHISPKRFTEDGYLEVDDQGRTALKVRSHLPNNPGIITVTYDKYGKDEFDVKNDDLDVEIYDSQNRRYAYSDYRQGLHKNEAGEPDPIEPHEEISVIFDKNKTDEYYSIYIKKVSGSFNLHDTVTVTVRQTKPVFVMDTKGLLTVPAVEFLDAKGEKEIPVVADNKNVITFGDTSPYSARGGALGVPGKPDALINIESATFEDQEYSGTSHSLPYGMASIVTMKKHRPSTTVDMILNWIATLPVEKSSGQASVARTTNGDPNVNRIPFAKVLQNPYYKQVYNALTDTADAPVTAGYYPDNGRLVYGIRFSPNRLKAFEMIDSDYANYYEYYVRYYEGDVRKNGVITQARVLDARYRLKDAYNTGEKALYPWQYGSSGVDSDWVQLRLAVPVQKSEETAYDVMAKARPWEGRIWKMPTPTQLQQLR